MSAAPEIPGRTPQASASHPPIQPLSDPPARSLAPALFWGSSALLAGYLLRADRPLAWPVALDLLLAVIGPWIGAFLLLATLASGLVWPRVALSGAAGALAAWSAVSLVLDLGAPSAPLSLALPAAVLTVVLATWPARRPRIDLALAALGLVCLAVAAAAANPAVIGLSLGLGTGLWITSTWARPLWALQNLRRGTWDALGFRSVRTRFAADVATIYGAGWTPRGGGTVGAIAALPVAFLLSPLAPALRLVLLTLLALWLTAEVRHYMRQDPRLKDPQEVVADEFIGVLISLSLVPWSLPLAGLGFVLFRALDIGKPFPVSWLERNFGGALGVMLDDIGAGVLAGLFVYGLYSAAPLLLAGSN